MKILSLVLIFILVLIIVVPIVISAFLAFRGEYSYAILYLTSITEFIQAVSSLIECMSSLI